jgi:hypothetical protein
MTPRPGPGAGDPALGQPRFALAGPAAVRRPPPRAYPASEAAWPASGAAWPASEAEYPASEVAWPGRAGAAPRAQGLAPAVIAEPALVIIEPRPSDYAAAARTILRRTSSRVGVVLSVIRLLPADGQAMIDTRTAPGRWRPRLISPPAHVVRPAEVYEVPGPGVTFRYVWILANARSVFPVGGILFLPAPASTMFHLVTFNVGALDDGLCTNVHHAEMQAVRWIEEQPRPWQARIGGIAAWNLSRRPGLGYGMCSACCADLARFLTGLKALRPQRPAPAIRASFTWLTRYDKNRRCGHPTDPAGLRRMAASGWLLSGPGWPP